MDPVQRWDDTLTVFVVLVVVFAGAGVLCWVAARVCEAVREVDARVRSTTTRRSNRV